MPTIYTSAMIERAASALISGAKELPIAVNVVASALSLDVEPTNLGDDVSGILVVTDGAGVIGVNKDHPIVRQRFTVAHEIGHFVLHRDEEQLFIDKSYRAFFRDEKSATGSIRREREANAFAAALLMPAVAVKRSAKSQHFELGDEGGPIEELARLFHVSTQAMTFRLSSLAGC